MLPWIALFLAGLLEIGWAVGLKFSDGFSKPLPSVLTIAAMIASMALLAFAVKTIPVGTGYAIWTGIGAVGAATLGILLFHEPANAWRIACLACIVLGILGLKIDAVRGPAQAVAPTVDAAK
jgi:quaternary ammonium compound-resistance protein SugE